MTRLFRRRGPAAAQVGFCDGCAQVCTAQSRAEARIAQVRAQALTHLPHLR